MKQWFIIGISILLFGLLVRSYDFRSRLPFGMDQENEFFIMRNISNGTHFPLIGLSIGDTGIYRGPFWLYAGAVIFRLSSGNPMAGGYASLAVFSVSLVSIILAGRTLSGSRAGLIAGLLYSASFLTSFYDRPFWNPMVVPVLSVWIGYSLILSLKDSRWIVLSCFLVGLGSHSHASVWVFFPLLCGMMIGIRKRISRSILIIAVTGFLITQIPIAVFDIRHQGTNVSAIVNLVSRKTPPENGRGIPERMALLGGAVFRFFWSGGNPNLLTYSGQCKELSFLNPPSSSPAGWIIIGLLVLGMVFSCKKNLGTGCRRFGIPLYLIGSGIFFTLFWGRNMYEYYYGFLFPWVAIVLGIFAAGIAKTGIRKISTGLILLIFVSMNITSVAYAQNDYPYTDKMSAMDFIRNRLPAGVTFDLRVFGECTRWGGYRYLAEYGIYTPSSSYMDPYFSWLYPDDQTLLPPEYSVVFSLIDDRMDSDRVGEWNRIEAAYVNGKEKLDTAQFGRIQATLYRSKG